MMCIAIALLIILMLIYYSDAVLTGLSLTEQVGQHHVVIAGQWEIVQALWPVMLLFVVLGGLLVLLWLKVKKGL
ncbi:MAG: hypothetical protein R3219_02555 [Hydrogenovibrio sp.]|nr:hypothetical protein [Hydrogenovibrio sp.]